MSFVEGCRAALRALAANKLRSFLTVLGVVVGVAAVVTMLAVGAGAQTQIADQIRSLGANVLMVTPGAARQGGVRQEGGTRHTLTESDAAAIAREVPLVQAAAPSVRARFQIIHGNRNWNTTVNGTTPEMFFIREWPLQEGGVFSERDLSAAERVALLGTTVARELFGEDKPVGSEIRIGNVAFQVIGVLQEKGPSGAGAEQDDIVFVPISTAKLRLMGSATALNREAVAYILAKAVSDAAMLPAQSQIEALLRQRHRLQPGQEDDFRVANPAAAMQARSEAAQTIAWLLASVASICLVVGGISIMNIMLVSVSERTREIGLRLALGARRRDLRNQFLTEAITLCLVGGIIGVLVGAGASWAVARFAGWPILIGIDAALFALAFAAAVGVFFGWYPARKAARLTPVEALRSE